MSLITPKEQRDVIPNWRSYRRTGKLGELFSLKANVAPAPIFPIQKYIWAWRENQAVPFAADLISAAIVNGNEQHPEVIKAARFILASDTSSIPLRNLAKSLLVSDLPDYGKKDISTDETLRHLIDNDNCNRELIRFIRQENNKFPYNPIAYCELARCYVQLGQTDKAIRAMGTAIYLAPESRYITRCAARLHLLIGDSESAHQIVAHNPAIIEDPWLLASEIAINTSIGRNSRFAKRGMQIIQSGKFSPFCCSELASAIGTLEMVNGKRKKCTSFINTSLLFPNDNSLAQAEWLKSEYLDLRLVFGDYSSMPLKSEADARYAFYKHDYVGALSESVKWIEDLPYDKTPILFSSSIAHTFLKDYDIAAKILRIGLIANPTDTMLLNNLAYVLALNGQLDEAETIMSKPLMLDSSLEIDSRVCHTATKGLIDFRKGNKVEGRRKYLEAIELANTKSGDRALVHKAILNYLREELVAETCSQSDVENIIAKIDPGLDREMIQLKNDVLNEINKYNPNTTHVIPIRFDNL